MRLIEVVAIICHDTAVSLFGSANGGLRKPDVIEFKPAPVPGLPSSEQPIFYPVPPRPVELFHSAYMSWEQYPNGIADIVGYWAEYRLFGGVVLFDRGESGTEVQ